MRDTELDALVVRHRETARRVARKFAPRLPVGSTTDDLEAAVWAECWQAIVRAEGGRKLSGDLGGYVFAAAVLAARRFCTRNRNRGIKYAPRGVRLRVASEAPDGEGAPLADLAVAHEAAPGDRPAWSFERWQQVLSRITVRARRVVILRVFRGLEWAAVAEAMGLSRTAVTDEWAYAVRTLRELFPELEAELTCA